MDIRNKARNKFSVGGLISFDKIKKILCLIGIHKKKRDPDFIKRCTCGKEIDL
jgi:hypothetical protein